MFPECPEALTTAHGLERQGGGASGRSVSLCVQDTCTQSSCAGPGAGAVGKGASLSAGGAWTGLGQAHRSP